MISQDIIVAPATPLQPAQRAIVRLSGEGCHALIHSLVDLKDPQGRLQRAVCRDPLLGIPVRLMTFHRGRSYTGEELIEVHLPGHPYLVNELMTWCLTHGARRADKGEFTRRAVTSGRLGLEQAQAVLDIITATDIKNHKRATAALTDRSRETRRQLQELLQQALMAIENELDFDEADEGLLDDRWFDKLLEQIQQHGRQLLGDQEQRDLPLVVLSGPVNVGKSTLFNALGGKALTSHVPGTTRDWLEVEVDLGGRRCRLADLPGTDGPQDAIDRESVSQAALVREQADLVVRMNRLSAKEAQMDWQTCADLHSKPWPANSLSAHTGEGLEAFKKWLLSRLSGSVSATWLNPESRRQLQDQMTSLSEDHQGGYRSDAVIWSAHLRELTRLLDPLGTPVHPDHVLHDLFSRFCIGK